MAAAQDRQKEYSDKHGRGNLNVFNVGELVLLDTRNLPLDTVSSVGSNKLKHRFIGPFTVLARHRASNTIDLPKSMKTHPTFYSPQGEERPQTSTQRRSPKARAGQQGRNQDRTPEEPRTIGPQGVRRVRTIRARLGARQGRLQTWLQNLNTSDLAEALVKIGRKGPAVHPPMQHHRQSQGLVQSQAREHVDGGGQLQGPETDPQVEHSDESGSPEVPGTRIRTRAHPPLLDRNGEVHYHVERVLVKWRGYAHSENSWEPIEKLQADCPKAVAIWEQKRRQLRK
ncbi:hypothetical protein F441_23004 [Phytophthora nicotianae CJ01A1]|uniref:Chromo domain-containing protein n=1 Tax=Phytophthora nicotianae CJ01A1 TaxID=1317063 RepID=W2VN21_PHYNI|nr:hypothetical protein F441_23004 [Phytophthora nicotianae CJ01A1]